MYSNKYIYLNGKPPVVEQGPSGKRIGLQREEPYHNDYYYYKQERTLSDMHFANYVIT